MLLRRPFRIRLAAALVAAALPLAAHAEAIDGDRIVIIDGDTVALPCVAPSKGCAEKIRFIDIDAPETFRPRCENERRVGLEAKARVAKLLRGATVYVERSGRKDRYGRTLANLTTADGDVGDVLVRGGLALPYRPGAEAKAARTAHWCGENL
ncbi:endonuclease YncB(thermonuclease family) [Kaistia hirudinis]|uniref:Endonuclease YncB(Thermonuclease family) n=1 Tax=Kaistia hirudinis TaxID=1293440 RepID=A0A840APJ7_9HYPH|nr:thermonuclease family protein [Kaistia hirudinis]MBB3931218.1 endonuclease YncB(thermonuclease family) [Kaistia hirudinis]